MSNAIDQAATECKKLIAQAFTKADLEEEGPPSPLVSKEQHELSVQSEWEEIIDNFFYKIDQGMGYILEELPNIQEEKPKLFTKKVEKELFHLIDYAENLPSHVEEFTKEFLEGESLSVILGIGKETSECFYQATKKLYTEKRYEEASYAFSVMVLLEPTSYDCWQALGNCEYFLENFEAALYAYAFAAYADPFQPLCHILSAQCYEAIKEYDNAVNACEIALHVIGEQTNWQHLINPIEEMKKKLEMKRSL